MEMGGKFNSNNYFQHYLSKSKIHVPHNPAFPLIYIFIEMHAHLHQDICNNIYKTIDLSSVKLK